MSEQMAVVLHWWNNKITIKPYLDRYNPIVLSVACIRASNPFMPIYVIDASDCNRPDSDWSYYPYKLNFTVIKVNSYLRELDKKFQNMYINKLLSRVWDVEISMRDIIENIIIYIDVDIFCLNPFMPIVHPGNIIEYFHASNNNGMWVYDKRSWSAKLLFDTWKGMICRIFHDLDFRREIYVRNRNYGTFAMQDEIVYRTILAMMQNHVRPIPMLDNYLFYWTYKDKPDVIEAIRGIHCLNFVTGKDRRRMFLVIKEFWNQIIRVFDNLDINMIFEGEVPGEMVSLKDFYYSESAVNRFLDLVKFSPAESCFKGFIRDMRRDDDVRVRLL